MNLTNNMEKKHTCTYLWISWNVQQPSKKHEIWSGPQWCKSLHERAMWNLELVAWWIATWIWSWKMVFWCSSKYWKPYLKSMMEYFISHLFANLVHQQDGFQTRSIWLRPKDFHNQKFLFPRDAHQQDGFQAFQGLMALDTGFHHQILFGKGVGRWGSSII